MEHNYVIYCHTNIINGMKYIGQTCQELEKDFQMGMGIEIIHWTKKMICNQFFLKLF